MPRIEIPRKWTGIATDHECGSCYACCVYLGIEELKKYTGQACKHLCGGSDPSKRCSIYSSRPQACQAYECLWRAGWGPNDLRPSESGLLITPYNSERNPGKSSVTVNVIDTTKAQPYINTVLGELFCLPVIDEVRLIYIADKRAVLFRDGKIYRCRLLQPDNFEELKFEAEGKPIGSYHTEGE